MDIKRGIVNMTWLQFMIGTEGMLAIAKHGLLGIIKEGICNFGITMIVGLIFLGIAFIYGYTVYDYIKIERELWY